MRKFALMVNLLVIVVLISGCANEPKIYSTIASPFSSEQMEKYELEENVYDYYSENSQNYKRKDGKNVIYLYSAPIEHSQDSIEEYEENYQFDGTYFNKNFPKKLTENTPINIGDTDNFAKIYLQDKVLQGNLTEQQNVFELDRKAIIYKDAFGKEEDFICYATSFGVNTEIIIPRKSDKYKYQIKVQLPNLVPDTSSPDYVLLKTALEKGTVKSILYTPLIVDKKGKWSYANKVRLIDKDSKNNIYTVEYEIDKDFINDKSTKFPVTMNQSIYLYKSKQPDTSAYQKTGDKAGHYLSPYILLGDSTLKGEGWTYVRFETLNSLNIDVNKVISAKYVFHNIFDLNKETIIGAYAVTADWCSINTRWINRPPFNEKPISEVIVKDSGDYKLDITSLFIEMLKNKGEEESIYSIRNSFMIKSNTKDSNVILPSGDNGLFSPFLEVVLLE